VCVLLLCCSCYCLLLRLQHCPLVTSISSLWLLPSPPRGSTAPDLGAVTVQVFFVALPTVQSLSLHYPRCNRCRCITHGAVVVVALPTVQLLSLYYPRCNRCRCITHGSIVVVALPTVQLLSLYCPRCNRCRCINYPCGAVVFVALPTRCNCFRCITHGAIIFCCIHYP
jgi:hypothetical protein